MREVFDELPIAMLAIDGDGTLSFVNREAERLLPRLAGGLGGLAGECLPVALPGPATATATEVRAQPVVLDGQAFDALSRPLPGGPARGGHLVLLLPRGPAA
jgi:PAS domain-containing protein